MILVGDIGGTRTRLALAQPRAGGWGLSRIVEFATTADVVSVVAQYLADAGAPALETAAFCGAGTVAADGRIQLTNAGVLLDPGALAGAARLPGALLINDFAAIAHAIPQLPDDQLVACGGGIAAPDAPRIILGPGTGLGMALATPAEGGWVAIAGEGGHADLAPVDDEQLAAWRKLRAAHGRVSIETVLCGPGLARLHAVLTPGRPQSAEEIAEAAWRGEPAALRAVGMFTRWLGSVAGNLALTAGARGGVYIAGGIVPGWGGHFDAARFREAFEDKAPFAGWLRAIPVFVVMHPQPGLLGLAAYAAASLQERGS